MTVTVRTALAYGEEPVTMKFVFDISPLLISQLPQVTDTVLRDWYDVCSVQITTDHIEVEVIVWEDSTLEQLKADAARAENRLNELTAKVGSKVPFEPWKDELSGVEKPTIYFEPNPKVWEATSRSQFRRLATQKHPEASVQLRVYWLMQWEQARGL